MKRDGWTPTRTRAHKERSQRKEQLYKEVRFAKTKKEINKQRKLKRKKRIIGVKEKKAKA